MPGKSYGAGGKWIHDRAEHILQSSDSLDGEKGKSIAYALATQQAHRLGKSPKGYGTEEGKQVAKQKYDQPKSHYTQTARPKTAAEIVDEWLLKNSAGMIPSIPTPKFPTGLQRVAPNSVKPAVATKPGKAEVSAYTQVHSQPPAVNSAPYESVKSAPPPPATR